MKIVGYRDVVSIPRSPHQSILKGDQMATRQHKPIPPLSESDIARFMSKISISPSGCWLWTAAVNNHGYGFFGIGRDVYLAHRVAVRIATGEDPGEYKRCHTCDTTNCVNPEHTYSGTQQTNVQDMIDRGRKVQVRGETHPRTRLTWDQVQEIKRLYRPGEMGSKDHERRLYNIRLAERFGICVAHAYGIYKGRAWKHKS